MQRTKYADIPIVDGWLMVDGRSYFVTEKSGHFRANMNGYFGWAAVWATTIPDLMSRIRQAHRGRQ